MSPFYAGDTGPPHQCSLCHLLLGQTNYLAPLSDAATELDGDSSEVTRCAHAPPQGIQNSCVKGVNRFIKRTSVHSVAESCEGNKEKMHTGEEKRCRTRYVS